MTATLAEALLVAVVVLPAAAGAGLALAGRAADRWAPAAAVALSAAVAVGSVLLVAEAPVASTPFLAGSDLVLDAGGLAGLLLPVLGLVATLVLLVASAYPETAQARFAGLMLLFVAAAEVTVLAGTLPALLLGWEVMGAASYALIGYTWRDQHRVSSGTVAFLTTRTADLGLYVAAGAALAGGSGLTLDGLAEASPGWRHVVAAGILVAALGKAAQLPFSFWLSRAMDGPSPVSALLHSAAMVALGGYLLLRTAPLLTATGWADDAAAWAGVVTAVVLGAVAVVQRDLKQLLAASTAAQLGFVVLAAGVGATAAGTAHLVAHAAVKALLFLAAGVWLEALGTKQLEGLRGAARRWPAVGACAVAGLLSLSGVPPLALWATKDAVLAGALEHSLALYVAGLVASALAAGYAGRAVVVLLSDRAPREELWDDESTGTRQVPPRAVLALVPLAVVAVVLGVLALEPVLARVPGRSTVPATTAELVLSGVLALLVLAGARGGPAPTGRSGGGTPPGGAPARRMAGSGTTGAGHRHPAVPAARGRAGRLRRPGPRPRGHCGGAVGAAARRGGSEGRRPRGRRGGARPGARRTSPRRARQAPVALGSAAPLLPAGRRRPGRRAGRRPGRRRRVEREVTVLSVLVFLPLLAGALLLAPGVPDRVARWAFLGVALVEVVLVGWAWARYEDPGPQGLALEEQVQWIPGVRASYHVGVDGLSLPLVALTVVVFAACAAYALREQQRPRLQAALYLMLEGTCLGLFVAADLILFFVFFDLSIVAMYLSILGWGHGDRARSALRFFLYTFLGSLALLVGFVGLYVASDPHTFDMVELSRRPPLQDSGGVGVLVLGAVLLGLAVKTPTFPFHTWLPPAHTDAPAIGSAVLAGVLLKMGTYGFVRIAMPMLPDAWRGWAPVLLVVGIVSVLWGALVALAQTDLKRMIAYTSVNHMGYVVLAVAAAGFVGDGSAGETEARGVAVTGAVTQMVSHGLLTAALFLLAGVMYERRGSYDLASYGGLAGPAPRYAAFLAVAAFGSLGIPGLSGFVAEFQIFAGSIATVPISAVATVGILLTSALFLRALQQLLTGPTTGLSVDFPDLAPGSGCRSVGCWSCRC